MPRVGYLSTDSKSIEFQNALQSSLAGALGVSRLLHQALSSLTIDVTQHCGNEGSEMQVTETRAQNNGRMERT